MRPTPELSFAVKHLNCHAGIVLTASHNPPEYNGYKVYWQDGGQIVPPNDVFLSDPTVIFAPCYLCFLVAPIFRINLNS